MENNNDLYLSDWLDDKISDEELKEIVSESDFIAYKKLRNSLDSFELAAPNLSKNYNSVIKKIESRKVNIEGKKKIHLWKYITMAACFTLFFVLSQMLYFSNTVNCDSGKIKLLTLTDNSKVTLNSNSKISYPNLFILNRTLKLEGEAYFEVEKGSTFTVRTDLGSIKVLGTKFNVSSFKDYFEVTCYEGKVVVENKKTKTILTPSESVRFYKKEYDNWKDPNLTKPSWIVGESTFKNTPVKYIFDKLQNQYTIKINYPKEVEDIKFTGGFTHSNLNTALKSICIPLNLKYTIGVNGVITVLK
jgi:transmembrane sensor